jgi:hypothetical protein
MNRKKKLSFGELYALVEYNMDCPSECSICEDNFMQLLPGEIEYLSDQCKISKTKIANKHILNGKTVWMIRNNEKDCNFYKCGRCMKREIRPLDCRTYPVVPCFKNNKISARLSEECPLVKSNSICKEFIKKAVKSWKVANPPKWWMKIYEKECLDYKCNSLIKCK